MPDRNLALLILALAFFLVSCATYQVSSPGNSAYGHCQAHKHSCAKYQKEMGKKHPNARKIEQYRNDCAEYNRQCR